jgi:chemotaxis protein methyltransferase CheR
MAQRFDFIRNFVRKRAGIVLEEHQDYLIDARLAPVAVRVGLRSVEELQHHLTGSPTADVQRWVIEGLTTHETSFFRDTQPFDLLRSKVLPTLLQRRGSIKTLRIWSAACSTGQEPYSIAMLLTEHFPELASWHVTILATDLSNSVLDTARLGRFSAAAMARGLPAHYQQKYFVREGSDWVLSVPVRSKVSFRQLNFIERWPSPLPLFDIVFCRNVLIYFDTPTRESILGKIREQMSPDGILFVGTTESTATKNTRFKRAIYDQAGCYEAIT